MERVSDERGSYEEVVKAEIEKIKDILRADENATDEEIAERLGYDYKYFDAGSMAFFEDMVSEAKYDLEDERVSDSKQLKHKDMRRIKDADDRILNRGLDLLDDVANLCVDYLKDLKRQDLSDLGDGSVATVGVNSRGEMYVMFADGDSKFIEELTPNEIVDIALGLAGIA